MNTIIISIGDELVLGQTIDTNSAWLSRQLAAIGRIVRSHITVGDDKDSIATAIRENTGRCDLMLISGGLGPTKDDLTRHALAAVMNVPLELHEQAMTLLEQYFRSRNRPMAESNRIQAMLPRGSVMIENTCGTACGMSARIGNCAIYVMPGVPREMNTMFTRDILPSLRTSSGGAVILSRTLHTFGLGESVVGQMLGDLMNRDRNPSVGTTVSGGVVSLRINSRFDSPDRAKAELDATDAACRTRMGSSIYGADEETLPKTVAALLIASGKTVVTAESCTGGLLAGMFTEVPGSSAYFLHGYVTYSNESKQSLLRVKSETLDHHGAVSEETVREMAENARADSNADFALSISGVAGPDGGTPAKPVGTVCLGFAYAGGAFTRTLFLFGDRDIVRDRACKTALMILRYHLLGEPIPF